MNIDMNKTVLFMKMPELSCAIIALVIGISYKISLLGLKKVSCDRLLIYSSKNVYQKLCKILVKFKKFSSFDFFPRQN
jgi:hypothetical protein